MAQEQQVVAFGRSEKSKTTGGQGMTEIVLFSSELVAYMRDLPREELVLSTVRMVLYIKRYRCVWFASYMDDINPRHAMIALSLRVQGFCRPCRRQAFMLLCIRFAAHV